LRANVAQLKPNSLEITDIHVYGKCSSWLRSRVLG
jgi:hypothetical protein